MSFSSVFSEVVPIPVVALYMKEGVRGVLISVSYETKEGPFDKRQASRVKTGGGGGL